MAITPPTNEAPGRLAGLLREAWGGSGGILVVDDDESIREVIATVLRDEGCEVRTARNGESALALLADWCPDLILLDVRMPEMDGAEVARRYRALLGPHAPVVLLTALSDGPALAEALGAVGYLTKPFELDDLLEVASTYSPCVEN
ncbi:MAG: hypothetical protein QOF51_3127 [Chloroflexota bacterium]|jgi:CheY-like chemotaxis protein|nr:hypothetical protein [Chloroflexota bacterium]